MNPAVSLKLFCKHSLHTDGLYATKFRPLHTAALCSLQRGIFGDAVGESDGTRRDAILHCIESAVDCVRSFANAHWPMLSLLEFNNSVVLLDESSALCHLDIL